MPIVSPPVVHENLPPSDPDLEKGDVQKSLKSKSGGSSPGSGAGASGDVTRGACKTMKDCTLSEPCAIIEEHQQHSHHHQHHRHHNSSSNGPNERVEDEDEEDEDGKRSTNCQSFSSKILLCGGSSGHGGESKRKEVDENNPNGSGGSDVVSSQTSKGRKSSRKNSKKKSRELIPMKNIENEGSANEKATSSQLEEVGSGEKKSGGEGETDHNHENNQGTQSAKNSCCFCWCCCCSCNGPNNICNSKRGNKENNHNQEHKNQDAPSSLEHFFSDDQPPSIEEIRGWGESFDRLMKCPWGRKVFREFLKSEFSEENIMFWFACEDLKSETDPKVVEEKCRIIYDEFVSILSPKEVSLDSRVREVINKNMSTPSRDTFEEAQLQIYTLMHRDSYPRFVNSTHYKQMISSSEKVR